MDQTGIAFLDIIFFAMVAGFLILRLRSVLGRRSGEEKPERWRPQAGKPPVPGAPRPGDAPADNVTQFPEREAAPAATAEPPAPGSVEAGIAAIKTADPSFDAKGFEGGARAAFEMIVNAFAQAGCQSPAVPKTAGPSRRSGAQAAIRRQDRFRATKASSIRSLDQPGSAANSSGTKPIVPGGRGAVQPARTSASAKTAARTRPPIGAAG